MFQKNVKKLRKIDKKKLTKPSDERTDVTYHCPIVGCRKTFDRLKRLCHHVEKRHSQGAQVDSSTPKPNGFRTLVKQMNTRISTKEYIVFMTSPDFLDYLGVKCDSCGQIHTRCRKWNHSENKCISQGFINIPYRPILIYGPVSESKIKISRISSK